MTIIIHSVGHVETIRVEDDSIANQMLSEVNDTQHCVSAQCANIINLKQQLICNGNKHTHVTLASARVAHDNYSALKDTSTLILVMFLGRALSTMSFDFYFLQHFLLIVHDNYNNFDDLH